MNELTFQKNKIENLEQVNAKHTKDSLDIQVIEVISDNHELSDRIEN